MRILLELVFLCIFIFIFGCGPGAGDGEADATDVHEEPDGTPEEVVDTREEDVASDSGEEDGSHPDVECFRDEECNDDDPCTADTCNLAYGACEHETLDADGDGYRAAKVGDTECGGMDCDDSRDDVYPGADLFCDGEDHDCSGRPDFDEDRDGYLSAELCSGTGDDCDDTNPDAYPGALTDCQAFDADCDGRVENDLDGDGHIGMSCGGNDCDDEDDAVYRGAFELTCDGKDTDCNGAMDGFEDADHDGYANEDCVAPGEEVDCNDGNGAIFPGATEVCDMIDQDCDGTWADGGADDDLDGYLDDDCGGNDCDDTREDVFPDAPEVCNDGVDQDCDGLVDGFTIMLDDVRITSDGIGSYSPALVWTGSEYGVSLKHGGGEDAEIYFVRISEAGSKTGTDVRITNHGGRSYYPSLVWTGSEYGVSWCDDRDGNYEIYFTRISDDGSKIGSDVRVTNDGGRSYYPSLVWTGSEYGVSWCDDRDGNYEIYFTRISDDGSKIGSDVRVTNDGGRSYYPSLVWTGSDTASAGRTTEMATKRSTLHGYRILETKLNLMSGLRVMVNGPLTPRSYGQGASMV